MAIPGTVPVGGIFAPTTETDEYPVSDPQYGIDGLRNVKTTTERNAIPVLRRRGGMIVGVTPEIGSPIGSPGVIGTTYYKLLPEPWLMDDSDWELLELGESEAGLPAKYIYAGEEWIVPLGKQNLIYGDITIEGILNIQGDVTIINGSANIVGGGSITGPGTLNIVDFYTEYEIDVILLGLINGTTNYVPRFTPDGHHIGDSTIRDDGSTIGINASPISNTQLFIDSSSEYSVSIRNRSKVSILTNQSCSGEGYGYDQSLVTSGGDAIGVKQTIFTDNNAYGFYQNINANRIAYGIQSIVSAGDGSSYGGKFYITSRAGEANICGLKLNVVPDSTGVSAIGLDIGVGSSNAGHDAIGINIDLNNDYGTTGIAMATSSSQAYGTGISVFAVNRNSSRDWTGLKLYHRNSSTGEFYPINIDDGNDNIGRILQVIDTSGNMQLVIPPTSSDYIHNELTGIEGGDTVTPHYYHSDQPINTTDDVEFNSGRFGDFASNGYVWDIGYSDTRAIGTFQIVDTDEGGVFAGLKSRGTPGAPTAVHDGDNLLSFKGSGYDGNTWRTSGLAGFTVRADDTWTAVSNPTSVEFYIVKPNELVNRYAIATAHSSGLFEFSEAIKVGTNSTSYEADGVIRFNGTNFQGYKDGAWVNLDYNGSIRNSNESTSTTTTVDSFAITEADGMKLFYTVKDSTGNNMRAGEILVVWNDTNFSANEATTTDFGDTSGIEIGINLVASPGTIEINATITSGTWDIKTRRELIK